MRAAALAALLAVAPLSPGAETMERCPLDAMVVFDGSGSMASMGFNGLDEPRIFAARDAVRAAAPAIAPVRKVGLVVYGPGTGGGCANIDLRFPPTANAAPRIIAEVDAIEPAGETPLTDAVRAATAALGWPQTPGVVVLVTDGKETCSGAPCQLAAELAAGPAELTVHVIGFQVRSDFFRWRHQDKAGAEDGVTPPAASPT